MQIRLFFEQSETNDHRRVYDKMKKGFTHCLNALFILMLNNRPISNISNPRLALFISSFSTEGNISCNYPLQMMNKGG